MEKYYLTEMMYEGKSVKEAVEFVEKSFGKKVSIRLVNAVKKIAREQAGFEWE